MTDQGSEGLLSPYLRQQRFKAAKPYIQGRVLDVGCGSGSFSHYVESDLYLGVDRNLKALAKAKASYPNHRFQEHLPQKSFKFDTIFALAVIEHMSDPSKFLALLSDNLENGPDARIVVTTPHPAVELIHNMGAMIGLFSKEASEEHEELLDRKNLEYAGRQAGLFLVEFRRFLFGANQLGVFMRSTEASI